MKKKILVVFPTHRDRRELALDHVGVNNEIIFHEIDPDEIDRLITKGTSRLPAHLTPEALIHDLLALARSHQIDGVIATDDYPGCLFGSAIAEELAVPAARLRAVLLCQHKYQSRLLQKKTVPQATPDFALIRPRENIRQQIHTLALPFFVKPVKSYFSIHAYRITQIEQLERIAHHAQLPFLNYFDWFLAYAHMNEFESGALLAEGLLEGIQVTLEGHIYNGCVVIHGIVDSIMFPGTICFARFDYPSQLPLDVQERMHEIAASVMTATGFDNGIFNIEYMYDATTDFIAIIEINPRMASQFADIFEKVDGTNTYQVLLDIAVGQKPHYQKNNGGYTLATSFVLRTFEDAFIERLPTAADCAAITTIYPDARIEVFGREGFKLSDELQDGMSYRYGLINIGADDSRQLQQKYEHCRSLLNFEFRSI